jgi:hypothetical protein
MNKYFFIFLLSFVLLSCKAKTTGVDNLFVKKFASEHPEWQVSRDTIIRNITIRFQEFAIPAKISLLPAKEPSDCLRIGYLRLDRTGGDEDIKIFNVTTASLPDCVLKFNSDDEQRFEVMLILGEASGYKGIKKYSFKGNLGSINGLGEYNFK